MKYRLFVYFFIFVNIVGNFYVTGQFYLNGKAVITVTPTANNKQEIIFEGPPEWKGLEAQYKIGTEYSEKGQLRFEDGISLIRFDVDANREKVDGKPFHFFINNFPLVTAHSIYEYVSATNNIRNNATIDRVRIKLAAGEVGADQDWVLSVEIVNAPGMLALLKKLSDSNLKNGTIYLLISSHQDTGWEDTPQQCKIDRDEKIITPALELLRENPDFKFNVENMLSLVEYLDRNPQKKDEIYQLTKEGRLSWGGMYNQPYEEMYSGESLVREFYFGRKWFRENFPGLDTRTVWNVDVPGRTLQAAQLMSKAGIEYLLLSRQQQGLFEWQSPDGSKIKVYSPGDYGETWRQLRKSHYRTFRHFADYALEYQDYNTDAGADAVIPLMANKDMSPPFTYKEIIDQWNNLTYWEIPEGEKVKLTLPTIRYATPEEFFSALEKIEPELPVIQGERPNVWLYIHGPSHHKMLSANREGGILLTSAEKFATFNALLENDWSSYPQEKLNQAWKDHIYPDHGMGGKNGHITDQLFLDKSVKAKNIADSILTASINSIAGKINYKDKKGVPLVVFNSMSRERTNPVQVLLKFKEKNIKNFRLTDDSGKEVTHQVIKMEKNNKDYISQVVIMFVAKNVPSLGYKTYFVVPSKSSDNLLIQKKNQVSYLENDFYKIQLAPGGISQITDKEFKKDLFNTSKFMVGELFSMQSEGNGAGEFAQVQQPTMEGFEKISDYQPVWQNYDSGAIYQSVEFVQKIKHAIVKEKIILYHQLKKIDFQVSLLNWEGIQFREFRLAFPLNMHDGQVAYEVPFGKVEIGKDEMPGVPGERYQVKASDIRPRGILNWIGGYDNKTGITISSSVAVWDYLDPTDNPADYPMLQPILLASRRSCHGQGNWYLQEGDHHFEFSLTSHRADWSKGYHSALEHNEPLIPVYDPDKVEPILPLQASFMSLDKENVTISTIKKSEAEDKVILRIYETEGFNSSLNLESYFPIKNLMKCNLIEENNEIIIDKSRIEIGKYAIETFMVD